MSREYRAGSHTAWSRISSPAVATEYHQAAGGRNRARGADTVEDLPRPCRNFGEFGPGKGTARESGQRGKAVAGMVGLPAAAFWYITAIFRLICQCGIVAAQGLFGALSGNCP